MQADSNSLVWLYVLFLWNLFGAVFLIPSIVAIARECEHKSLIIAANVIFGAYFIVWIAVLIWSFAAEKQNKVVK